MNQSVSRQELAQRIGLRGVPTPFTQAQMLGTQAPIPQRPLSQRQATTGRNALQRFWAKITGLFRRHEVEQEPIPEPPAPAPLIIQTKAFGTLTLLPEILPKKARSDPQIRQAIAEKIDRGANLLYGLLSGDEIEPSLKNISDILWFLHIKAETKVGNHTEGAISIPDPEGKICRFLDSCKEVYHRKSSHIEDFQKVDGHRGIDFHRGYSLLRRNVKNIDELLPYARGTLLYGPLRKGVSNMPENRLWLKMEPFGAGLARGRRIEGLESRPRNMHDFFATVAHGWDYFKSLTRRLRGKNCPEGTFKERIPHDLKKGFKKLVKEFKKAGRKDVAQLMQTLNPAKTGIRNMLKALGDAFAAVPPLSDYLLNKIKDFTNLIAQKPYLDHFDVRIGKEVIFVKEDLIGR
jgi:hypothetical protein